MSYFGEVALGSSFQPSTTFREQFGFVPKLFRAQTLLPRVIEAEGALISAILFTDRALTRAQKECILLVLAAARGSAYCFSLHYQMLRLLGITEQRLDHIVADYQKADLAPATGTVLRFTLKLVASELSISREDVREASSEGLTDESLLEAILTAALSGLLCMLSTGVGAVPDFALHSIPPPEHFLTVPSDESPAMDEKSGFNLSAPELNAGDFAPFTFFREQFGSVPSVFLLKHVGPISWRRRPTRSDLSWLPATI